MVVIMKYIKEHLKNYNIFKISFVILTTFLLYEEFYVFFIEKPTHSSSSKLEIGLLTDYKLRNIIHH